MTHDTETIQKDFLNGLQELFGILFTNEVNLYLMDEDETQVHDVYGESLSKQYKEPIKLKGDMTPSMSSGDDPVDGFTETMKIRVPTKEFLDHNIPHAPSDYPTLRKAKIVFQDKTYYVTDIKGVSFVAETYLFYQFTCTDKPR